MKKLLFSLSLLASLATFAGESTVEATAQVFGVLPIYSTASNVIVSVPWVAASNTETNSISVAEVVKTAGLTAGDWIRSWDATKGRFNVWTLVLNGSGVLEWQASNVVDPKGEVVPSTSSTATYLERGDALILYRQFPTNFYVYGQYTGTTPKTITIAQGSKTSPAYTLLAAPATTAVNLNTQITWSNTEANKIKGGSPLYDRIEYGESSNLGVTYYYKNGKWGYDDASGGWVDAPAIPAGIGVWYVSRGGNPTLTWNY